MSQYIEWIYGPEKDLYNELIKQAVLSSLEEEGIEQAVEVSVMIVDDEEIRGINLEQRGKDTATDVLSFPMIEYGVYDVSLNEIIAYQPRHPETGEVYLGDVVISWDKVMEQSDDFGHSLERELAFLVVHSMLHLMGYDHMESEDEQMMITKQKEILGKMGLSR